jgi:hypothetical protein
MVERQEGVDVTAGVVVETVVERVTHVAEVEVCRAAGVLEVNKGALFGGDRQRGGVLGGKLGELVAHGLWGSPSGTGAQVYDRREAGWFG